jgi:hypothetical protein
MAVLCSKCGAGLPPGTEFCAACGTPVAASDAPGAPVASAPIFTPAQPPAAPASSRSSVVKIILIVVVVFVGLGILGAGIFGFMAWRISRAFHVSGSNGQVTLHTSGGTVTANPSMTFTASELGADIYPGAQSTPGGVRMDLPTGSMVSAVFLTSDAKDMVVSFYKGKLGSDASVFDTSDGAVLSVDKGQQESVVVTVTAKPSEDDGKTKIVIVHTKAGKPS